MVDATQNRIDAIAVVAIAATSLFVTAGGYVVNQYGNRLDEIERSIRTIVVDAVEVGEHVNAHNETAKHWISVIQAAENRCRSLDIRIDRLENRPCARADPFTGTEGRRLERMIKELGAMIDDGANTTD